MKFQILPDSMAMDMQIGLHYQIIIHSSWLRQTNCMDILDCVVMLTHYYYLFIHKSALKPNLEQCDRCGIIVSVDNVVSNFPSLCRFLQTWQIWRWLFFYSLHFSINGLSVPRSCRNKSRRRGRRQNWRGPGRRMRRADDGRRQCRPHPPNVSNREVEPKSSEGDASAIAIERRLDGMRPGRARHWPCTPEWETRARSKRSCWRSWSSTAGHPASDPAADPAGTSLQLDAPSGYWATGSHPSKCSHCSSFSITKSKVGALIDTFKTLDDVSTDRRITERGENVIWQ